MLYLQTHIAKENTRTDVRRMIQNSTEISQKRGKKGLWFCGVAESIQPLEL